MWSELAAAANRVWQQSACTCACCASVARTQQTHKITMSGCCARAVEAAARETGGATTGRAVELTTNASVGATRARTAMSAECRIKSDDLCCANPGKVLRDRSRKRGISLALRSPRTRKTSGARAMRVRHVVHPICCCSNHVNITRTGRPDGPERAETHDPRITTTRDRARSSLAL